jgi:citrate synthase
MTPTEFEALSLVAQTTHIVANVLGHRLMISDDRSAEAAFFLAMNGRMPTHREADLTRAVYVACLDHTPATPSSLAGLVSYSGGNSLKTALAAAITAMGDVHAGAGEGTAETLQKYIPVYNKAMEEKGCYEADGRTVKSIPELAQYVVDKITGKFGDPKAKVPGYGHRYYGLYGKDPRAVTMIELAKEQGIHGQYIQLALEIEKVLRNQKNPALCMNVDGVIGAVFSEIGMDWRAGKATFIIPRTVGVLGELLEQRAGSFFRLANESAVYVGPELGREYHPVGVAV